MGTDPHQTVAEIEETREELARKVDELVDRARVEAGVLTRKLAIGAAVVAGILVLGIIAKRRVR
jgi:Protein of unknown function (DUF3618)